MTSIYLSYRTYISQRHSIKIIIPQHPWSCRPLPINYRTDRHVRPNNAYPTQPRGNAGRSFFSIIQYNRGKHRCKHYLFKMQVTRYAYVCNPPRMDNPHKFPCKCSVPLERGAERLPGGCSGARDISCGPIRAVGRKTRCHRKIYSLCTMSRFESSCNLYCCYKREHEEYNVVLRSYCGEQHCYLLISNTPFSALYLVTEASAFSWRNLELAAFQVVPGSKLNEGHD